MYASAEKNVNHTPWYVYVAFARMYV